MGSLVSAQNKNAISQPASSWIMVASPPGPLYFLVLRGPGMQKYVMLCQRGCVHGDAMTSFQSASSSLVRVLEYSETDGRIAS